MESKSSSAKYEKCLLGFDPAELVRACDAGVVIHRHAYTQPRIDDRLTDLFTWSDLRRIAETDADHAGHWRFYRDGHQINPALMGLVDRQGQLCSSQLDQLLSQGMSVMVNRLELKLPAIGKLACKIEDLTGAYVRVVAIGSPGSAPGMPLHYDHVDVIAFQTAGAKTWLLFGPPVKGCGVARERDDKPSQITDQAELVSRDALFVPAGIHHRCLPSDSSLHLAFNLKWPTFLDLDSALTAHAKDDQQLLDPIRTFNHSGRINEIFAQLESLGSKVMTREQLTQFFNDWPSQCARRWHVSNLGDYF